MSDRHHSDETRPPTVSVGLPLMSMPLRRAEIAATGVGMVTLLIGAALGAAPGASARLSGLRDDRSTRAGLRVIGVVDFVVAIGLLFGRPRWPWVLVRATANVPTAAYLAWLARRDGARALVPAVAVVGLATVPDVLAGRALRQAGR